MGTVAGVTAGVVAGVTMKYTYDKYIHEQQMHKKLNSIPWKIFKRGPGTVKSVDPDRKAFSHNLKSPTWKVNADLKLLQIVIIGT